MIVSEHTTLYLGFNPNNIKFFDLALSHHLCNEANSQTILEIDTMRKIESKLICYEKERMRTDQNGSISRFSCYMTETLFYGV